MQYAPPQHLECEGLLFAVIRSAMEKLVVSTTLATFIRVSALSVVIEFISMKAE